MMSAPIMPMSSVLMLAMVASPVPLAASTEKSTPKTPPHCDRMVLTK